MSTKFYVYAYIRSVESDHGAIGTPYYIGKGTGYRAWHRSNDVCLATIHPTATFIVIQTAITSLKHNRVWKDVVI